MNFLPELIQKLGTVLVEVLVLIAEEVEKKNGYNTSCKAAQ